MISFYESPGYFVNRLYIARDSLENIIQSIQAGSYEYIGAGCASYGKLIGKFFCTIGLALCLQHEGKTYYVHKKSFCKLLVRMGELNNIEKQATSIAIIRLQELYNQNSYCEIKLRHQTKQLDRLLEKNIQDIRTIAKALLS